ncbi:MAG TPA: hypothetical protein VHF91_03585 [Acidimicrobiales bacterium]|nr:hypothetical protein [Acidimicrobiales bacterium]
MPEQLRVEILPEAAHEEDMAQATSALLNHDIIQVDFAGRDLWLVAHDVVDKGDEAGQRFTATIQDMDSGRVLMADGRFDELDYSTIFHTAWQRPASDDEFAWAVDSLKEDLVLGPALEAGELQAYKPMPPIAGLRDPDGNVERVVAVGLRSSTGEHRVVGVRTADGEVLHEPPGVAAPSTDDCGAPTEEAAAAVPGARQARVRVWQGDTKLWDLVVVRPSASSGTNGSGVELRTVDYLGARVLHRAHLPIVNVEYGQEAAAAGIAPAERHWGHEEAAFDAQGDEPVAGFRLCSARPGTILETGSAGGGFRGVALWAEGDEVVVVSQLEAGPYRYVNEWRLVADGTIRPRIGFSAATNSSTCTPHVHHAYWRLDFDILAPGSNVVREYNDPPIRGETKWHLMRFEVKRPRDASLGRVWRIRHDRDGREYSVVPGPADGTAADPETGGFGVGDVWVLRYDPFEMDDGQGFTTDPALARAGLDRFVSGEPVHSRDVVLWYGVHVSHPGDDTARVGPDLVPNHWHPKELPEPELLEEPPAGE